MGIKLLRLFIAFWRLKPGFLSDQASYDSYPCSLVNIKVWSGEPRVSDCVFTLWYDTRSVLWCVCVHVRARGLRPSGGIPWAQGLRSAVCMAQPTLTPSDLPPDIEFIGSFLCLDSKGIRHWGNQHMINFIALLEILAKVLGKWNVYCAEDQTGHVNRFSKVFVEK